MNTEQISQIVALNSNGVVGDMVIGLSGEAVIGSTILLSSDYILKYVLEEIDHLEIVLISKFDNHRTSIQITHKEWETLKHVM